MLNVFFHIWGIDSLEQKLNELSIITPFFVKGTMESIYDLRFNIFDTTENVYMSGATLYIKYRDVLFEANGLVLSGSSFQYEDFEKRNLLNYAVGFIKNEIAKIQIQQRGNKK